MKLVKLIQNKLDLERLVKGDLITIVNGSCNPQSSNLFIYAGRSRYRSRHTGAFEFIRMASPDAIRLLTVTERDFLYLENKEPVLKEEAKVFSYLYRNGKDRKAFLKYEQMISQNENHEGNTK